ncbi:LysR substrate-binding domain-containing protein [Xanthomonas sacchari]|uniref:LysR substrate-binding domain-containing protein n=1 Tax=Xanthomonas sacchari TaxID=56458 RepID=UPI003B20EFBA
MLDLRQLRYFVAVAETENVGRAAEQLYISQSPLSRQIKQLEEQLGVLLFERSKQRIRLTQEGRDLLGEVRTLIANANRVETFARRLGAGSAGRLAIGYVEGAMYANVVSPSVRAFRIASPSVLLSLQGLGTAVQFDYLRRHMLDVGLAYRMPERDTGLSSALVLDEPLTLAIPKGHPLCRSRSITPAQLDGQTWIAVTRQPVDTIRPALLAACQDAGFTPDIAYETSDPLASLYLVSAGLGVALVQSALKERAPAGIVFRDLPWLRLRVKLYLVWRSDDARPIVATFREAVSTFAGHALDA